MYNGYKGFNTNAYLLSAVRCFLFLFFLVRPAHLAYWGNHPRAVCILEKHREKLNTWLDACQVSNFFSSTVGLF